MHSLTNGATTLVLPEDLLWSDEFAWREVQQRSGRSVTGKYLYETALNVKGRPITLRGGVDYAWIARSDLLTLRTWRGVPGLILSLVIRGETARSVVFDHEAEAIEAAPIWDTSDVAAADDYQLILRFREV